MNKLAVIFGVTGQDGSYLSELLLDKGYEVVGVVRRSSVSNTERIDFLINNDPSFHLVEGDITDYASISGIIKEYKPDECYNLAAQSHVGTSFTQPLYTFNVCAQGPLNILQALVTTSPETRFYQASTSEMFGNNFSRDPLPKIKNDSDAMILRTAPAAYYAENTPLAPTSPYAIAKTAAHHFVAMYRQAYNLHASSGILFNHESERRGKTFVTRKITDWIGAFTHWMSKNNTLVDALDFDDNYIYTKTDYHTYFPKLRLGNLNTSRDWGHAEDYVKAMWMMVNADKPDDYIIATGVSHTLKEFLTEAFNVVNITDWNHFVTIDPSFCRPADVTYLCGNAAKAKTILGWEPIINFSTLVRRMVLHDIQEHSL